ncbi:MAG: ankyrin repeat domain-containing protein [Alphaproteobacteria bacterium]|nr:ankyrin repeat domain-containing protein [Alphaproteobacteria bacterium]
MSQDNPPSPQELGQRVLDYMRRRKPDDIAEAFMLLKAHKDIDLTLRDETEKTALMHAIWANSPDTAALIMQRGADINAKNREGWTPLIQAVLNNAHTVFYHLLKQEGLDIDATDHDGNTALMWAIRKAPLPCAKALIKAGADINAENKEGVFPLMETIKADDTDTARLLIEHGCNIYQSYGPQHLSPQMIAGLRGRRDIVALIKTEDRRRTEETFRTEAEKGTKQRRVIKRRNTQNKKGPHVHS